MFAYCIIQYGKANWEYVAKKITLAKVSFDLPSTWPNLNGTRIFNTQQELNRPEILIEPNTWPYQEWTWLTHFPSLQTIEIISEQKRINRDCVPWAATSHNLSRHTAQMSSSSISSQEELNCMPHSLWIKKEKHSRVVIQSAHPRAY